MPIVGRNPDGKLVGEPHVSERSELQVSERGGRQVSDRSELSASERSEQQADTDVSPFMRMFNPSLRSVGILCFFWLPATTGFDVCKVFYRDRAPVSRSKKIHTEDEHRLTLGVECSNRRAPRVERASSRQAERADRIRVDTAPLSTTPYTVHTCGSGSSSNCANASVYCVCALPVCV